MHPANPPSIAVLGTLTRDTTAYADGTRSENLGGLFYTLLTLAHLFEGRARILPVANVGADLFETVQAALRIPGVDLGAVRRVATPNNHVYLTYSGPEEREEVLVGLVPPVDLEHCRRAHGAARLLVNLTSGRDIALDTLQAFRREFDGVVQLDVHSLTLDIAPGGRRILRRPEAWESWVACADWVQMNETEARLLGGDGVALDRFATGILERGPRGVLVTLGARGCVAAWRQAAGVRHLQLDAALHPQPAFPTGCGDVFGATFAFAQLSGAAPDEAVRLANAVASTKAAFEPYAELARLRRHAAAHLQRWLPA
jgi:sugar/nucleoside kinase (ribokinase family)